MKKIQVNQKQIHLGSYETPLEASIAYENKFNQIMKQYKYE